MICKNCGNEIPDDSKNCIYCGCEVKKPITAVPLETREERLKNDKNDIGNTGFVYGIISICCFFVPLIPLITGIMGIVFSSIGLKAPSTGSKTRSILGLVFSITALMFQMALLTIIILAASGVFQK